MESSSQGESLQDLSIDTCKGSLIHIFTRAPEPDEATTWPSAIVTYSIAAFVFGLSPVLAACFCTTLKAGEILVLPLKQDWQTLWAGFVALPMLMLFLRSERALIPLKLRNIYQNETLKPTKRFQKHAWENYYRWLNIAAQGLGLMVGIGIALLNYSECNSSRMDSWIVTGEGHVRIAGWLFLVLHAGAQWFLYVFYVARAFMTLSLLWSIVRISDIDPRPFHPDRAGGLSEIGKLGLRNQYLLGVIGIQIVLAAMVLRYITQYPSHNVQSVHFLSVVIYCEIVMYGLFGPFVFVAPLMPFRAQMRNNKLRALTALGGGLQRAVDGVVRNLPKHPPTSDQEKEINRYRVLMKLVDREPVWPFDVLTLRRFFAAYLIPVLVWTLAIPKMQDYVGDRIGIVLSLETNGKGSSETHLTNTNGITLTNAPKVIVSPSSK